MDSRLHQELIEKTEELRALVGSASTETVAGTCGAYVLKRSHGGDEDDGLMSPLKQMYFLLGLMLTTSEPESPTDFGRHGWERSRELLNSVFESYAWMYFPSEEELPNLSERWWDARRVAIPAFLHHFNTGILASVEQVAERVRRYVSPFDERLRADTGISASEALAVADWISNSFQTAADELVDVSKAYRTARLASLERAIIQGRGLEEATREAARNEQRMFSNEVLPRLQNFLKVRLDALSERFGLAVANAYWNLFVSKRSDTATFKYLTERNPAEERPLFQVQEGVALCPLVNALYSAILTAGEDRLSASEAKQSFLKRRDKTLEREVEEILRGLFGESAEYYAGVFEAPTLQNEHDLVVRWQDQVFVIEVKSSPPVEPFRDPERAFRRIKRAFRSDTGLQKAFDQGNRIRRQLKSGEAVNLHNSDRERVTTIEPADLERTRVVCVTRDNFGPLAVYLSLLLKKDEGDPYPWAVNMLDLRTLVDAWEYFGWGADQLIRYLDLRVALHEKVLASDELEIAGFFVRHGGLEPLVNTDADRIQLDSSYSDVFDDIYRARHGGEEVVYAPTEPFMEDLNPLFRSDS